MLRHATGNNLIWVMGMCLNFNAYTSVQSFSALCLWHLPKLSVLWHLDVADKFLFIDIRSVLVNITLKSDAFLNNNFFKQK